MSIFEEHPHDSGADIGFDTTSIGDRDAPRQRSVRAAQRITALGEMTAGLAHDFRNILAVIGSAINLAERTPDDKAAVNAALAAAREGIQRGLRLTSRLLVFANPRNNGVHAEDVNELLANLKPFLEYGAGPDNRIRLDLGSDLPECPIDAPQFSAAILNLVVNARDAMPDGGEIRIKTGLVRLRDSEGADVDAECVLVRIIDEGQGMAKNVRERMFDPYFTTKGELGTGLGVPQVAAFMRSTGGCVNVNSEPGAGTSFDLYFPTCASPSLVGTNLWHQLDRWVNEGGRSAGPAPRFGH